MADISIRVPLRRLNRQGSDIFRIDLDVRGISGRYCRIPFRVDSASDFTMISIAVAERLNIPFATNRPVHTNTAAGKSQQAAYLSPITFSVPELSPLRFESLAVFSPYELKSSLLSIRDLVLNFVVRFPVAASRMPDGCAIFNCDATIAAVFASAADQFYESLLTCRESVE